MVTLGKRRFSQCKTSEIHLESRGDLHEHGNMKGKTSFYPLLIPWLKIPLGWIIHLLLFSKDIPCNT